MTPGSARAAPSNARPNRAIVARAVCRGESKGASPMKIRGFENLHVDAGWRNISFLKITTDEGLVGWSEYK